ncbi:30S ribosomal protein S4e [Candidatus Woesearchaeota archaeon]|nr:30S ribosomal protein S4e [Candidatus Woesearchaeota archaeon]
MVKNHLKRLASPKTWPIGKKVLTFVARPMPGAHKDTHQVPITVFLRDMVKVVDNVKEVKFVLHNKDCLVDGAAIHDNKRGVGIFDTIALPKLNKYYRVCITNKNKLSLIEIDEKESTQKVCKITGKKVLKGNKIQLNTEDGRNFLVDKDAYKVGDSVITELPKQKITSHLPLDKGALVYLIEGTQVGNVATVEAVEETVITIKIGDKVVRTQKDYAVVIGKDKPLLKVN